MTRPNVVEYQCFTGDAESDPHRIGFWKVRLDETGLTLECDQVPEGEREEQRVSWSELHQLLVVRSELADDIRHLRDEKREAETDLVRLRVEIRRLRAKVVRLRLEDEARTRLMNGTAPLEAPGIVPIRRAAGAQ